MSTQFPVHPDDALALLKIRRYLIGFRKTNGWSQPDLSQKISGTNGMAYDLESNPTWQWRLSRLQDWCVPFGLRLYAKLTFDAEDFDALIHTHPEVEPMFALSQAAGAWQKWQRMYLTSALSLARRELWLSTEEIGRRLGVTRKAVSNWEMAGDEIMLPKVLHHARVMGGRIILGLSEEDGAWSMGGSA